MSTENPAPAEPIEAPTQPEGATPDEPLGEPGLAALKSERAARAAAEQTAKDALAKVKAFEDAQKTEAEKQAERLAEFERENAELKSAKTRAEVAAAKGVPASLLSGSTQAELEASADALLAFRGETQPQRLIVPGEGKSPSNTSTPADQFGDFLKKQLGQTPA